VILLCLTSRSMVAAVVVVIVAVGRDGVPFPGPFVIRTPSFTLAIKSGVALAEVIETTSVGSCVTSVGS